MACSAWCFACLAPKPGETLIDPACGTGGFLIAMVLYIVEHFREMMREQHCSRQCSLLAQVFNQADR
jgi:type I restriction-modification system DNA methylase subunit